MSADDRVRWGVLGAANIALKKVIPAMQQGSDSRVIAIASRDVRKAQSAAAALGIERAYGSYQALLDDADVEAIYIPLPNHLHVPWTTRAAQAGKHVLCEKPIALNAAEARALLGVRADTGVQIGEAFMVRTHPQWLKTRALVRGSAIGPLRLINGHFSYYKIDPADIRSRADFGGGALMDIGCYPVTMSRWLFESEPLQVAADIERDPYLGVDRLASGLLHFEQGQASFTCSMQIAPYQRMHLFGTGGEIEVEIPWNAPPDRPCRIFYNGEAVEFEPVDQYTLQGDQFSRAVRGRDVVPVPLEDAVANMAVIDALFRAGATRRWETV